jgi:GNAT superfamily N-acetyltransferase
VGQGELTGHPTVRPGTLDDLRAVYDVFVRTTADLERRLGTPEGLNMWTDPALIADYWARHRTLFEHLTRSGDQFWVAEDEGRIISYARGTFHDGVRELIEFFVLPEHQATGVGRELLGRAFPGGAGVRRAVIATTDIRALSRYLALAAA